MQVPLVYSHDPTITLPYLSVPLKWRRSATRIINGVGHTTYLASYIWSFTIGRASELILRGAPQVGYEPFKLRRANEVLKHEGTQDARRPYQQYKSSYISPGLSHASGTTNKWIRTMIVYLDRMIRRRQVEEVNSQTT